MDPVVEVTVARLGLDAASNSHVVILEEVEGNRILPIWIGYAEAMSIRDVVSGTRHDRPMTHDLCKSLIVGLGASLQRVVVTRAEERTYFAEMHLSRGADRFEIDARPSDGIAIALRLRAPVFVAEDLLFDPPDEDDAPDLFIPPEPDLPPSGNLDPESLKKYLESLRPEDFGKFNP